MTNLEIVQHSVAFARELGADEAEAFLQRTRVLSIEVGNGEVETVKQAEDVGLALRAMIRGQMGLSHTTELSEERLRRTALRALAVAEASDPDPYIGLADPSATWPSVDGYDVEMSAHSADEKIDRAFAIERAARAYDARVVLTRRIMYQERDSRQAIANSRGLAIEQTNNSCGGSAMVIARQGSEQQVGWGSQGKRHYADFDAVAIGVEAAEHAVTLLGATSAPTQRASLLLEPKMTGAFMSIIANLVRADNVQKNKSLFAGKVGQRVAAREVMLIDDGAHPDAVGARAWDDEGTPSQRTTLIQDGILHGYLHTTYTARKANTTSTGNARRFSFKVAPDPMPSNLMLMPGTDSLESLRAGMRRGLWVKQLMNLHTANPISGEFSFGASGLWIENGHVVGPVHGVTIAGTLMELLTNIHGVANDFTWQAGWLGGSVGAPSVLIEDMSMAGK